MYNSNISLSFAGKNEYQVKKSRPLSSEELKAIAVANRLREEKSKGVSLTETGDQFLRSIDRSSEAAIEQARKQSDKPKKHGPLPFMPKKGTGKRIELGKESPSLTSNSSQESKNNKQARYVRVKKPDGSITYIQQRGSLLTGQ